jgi:3-hydroxyisobutyrate dehydrogenase
MTAPIAKRRSPGAVLKGIDPQPTNDVDLARKDLRTMLDEARSLGANLPLVEKVLEIYDRAAREGWGARDQSTLPSYWPKQRRSG